MAASAPLREGDEAGSPSGAGTRQDVEAGLQKAESLGGTRVMGPMDVPDGPKLGLFKDPEGNTVGLVSGM